MEFKREFLDIEEIPGFSLKTNIWTATAGKYTFIIVKSKVGYTATYRRMQYEGERNNIYLTNTGGTPIFKTLGQAETACRREFRKLQKN